MGGCCGKSPAQPVINAGDQQQGRDDSSEKVSSDEKEPSTILWAPTVAAAAADVSQVDVGTANSDSGANTSEEPVSPSTTEEGRPPQVSFSSDNAADPERRPRSPPRSPKGKSTSPRPSAGKTMVRADGGIGGGSGVAAADALLIDDASLDDSPRARMLRQLLPQWEVDEDFTDTQRRALEEFRTRLQEEGLLRTWWEDNTLLCARFCRARQWDVTKAIAMFRKHHEWRKQWALHEFVTTAHGLMPRLLEELRFPHTHEQLKWEMRFAHHKTTRNGMPMYFHRLGHLDVGAAKTAAARGSAPLSREPRQSSGRFSGRHGDSGRHSEGGLSHHSGGGATSAADLLLAYMIWNQEVTVHVRLPIASLTAGRLISKQLVVLDLQGFKLSTFNSELRGFVKNFVSIGADHFPETMEKTFIINAPFAFRVVWNFVRPLLDERVRNAISITGGASEYLPKLLQYAEEADLPEWLGGKDGSMDFMHEVGPWREHIPDLSRDGWVDGFELPESA
jgi:hypothetical protein